MNSRTVMMMNSRMVMMMKSKYSDIMAALFDMRHIFSWNITLRLEWTFLKRASISRSTPR